jgi:putative transcriptional regulator
MAPFHFPSGSPARHGPTAQAAVLSASAAPPPARTYLARWMHLLSRAAMVLVLCLSPVTLPRAALPNPTLPKPGAGPADPLVGQLLVASADIGDPRFFHAVILIVQHSQQGALGIMINRPIGEQPMAKLLQAVGQDATGVSGNVQVFAGGPVEPWLMFVVHSAEYHRAGTVDVDGRVAVTSSPEVLRDIGHSAGPRKSLVALGYAGWGPGQLENELAQHAWFTIPEDPKLVFDVDRDKVWDDAKARESIPL